VRKERALSTSGDPASRGEAALGEENRHPLRTRKTAAVTAGVLTAWLILVPLLLSAEDEDGAADQRRGPYAGDYVIGVEDLIQVTVWKNPDLSVTVPVRPDGKISLPLIDDVQAVGRTPQQLKVDLTDRWKAFLSAPEVSVIVKEINSFKVFLVGEVARPGELRLRDRTRLLQAISLAGGFTTFAKPEKIVLLRASGNRELRFEISFKKIVSGDRPEDNLPLHPGDTIYVP
jgi:polysaccharide export outer membrane protein